LRKIPTFIPLLESNMLIWENRGGRLIKTDGKIHKGQTVCVCVCVCVCVLRRSITPIQIWDFQVVVAS